ncbi:MAG: DUF4231 domain-containing protein [Bryobacteraceae bacterium]
MPAPEPAVIELLASDTPKSAVEKLKLPPRPLIILLGDFDPALNLPILSILSRAIAPFALDPGALIVDNGSCSGCAALIGEAARDQDESPPLLGIVTRETANLDPNHALFLRLPAEWSDSPVKYTFQIAAELAKDTTRPDKPVLAVLFGGGDSEKPAVIRCARRGWPVLVIQGSGGLADQISKAMAISPDGTQPPPPDDLGLREITDTATLYFFPLNGDADDLKSVLLGRVQKRVDTLADAWVRHDQLSGAAVSRQRLFRWLEGTLLVLAVVATFLAVLQSGTAPVLNLKGVMRQHLALPSGTLHILVLLTPIVISVLAAFNSHFREGYKWILLRGAAEAIKREIFRYRAQAGIYSDEQCVLISRDSKLAAKIKDISSGLEQSEVNKTSIPGKAKDEPARLQFLAPEEYVVSRIEDQIKYFTAKTCRLSRQLRWIQLTIYVVGGLGTFLAAIHLDVWLALSTSFVTALTTKLQTDQVETSLVKYNQALMSLRNVESWWKALSPWEKGRRKNIDVLVDQTEKTMETETAGWVQQMQSALDKLTEKEPASTPQQQSPNAAKA